MATNIYVLTAGPGAGKTWTINEIKKLGYEVLPEAAEMVKAEQLLLPDPIIPETNLEAFEELIAARQIDLESKVNGSLTIADRGLGDIVGYCKSDGLRVPSSAEYALRQPRYKGVFVLTPWPEYQQTKIRIENKETSNRLHQVMVQVWKDLGYSPIQVPLLEAPQRAQWIVNYIQNDSRGGE